MTTTALPTTAGQLLAHIERAGAADEWTIDTDATRPIDECQRLRRTFRLRALGDAECGVVAEFGHLFIALHDFDCLLADLWRPVPLSDVIATKLWATPNALAFVAALERLFPEDAMQARCPHS
ncbi:hypothetical protein [Cupriavidus oxalaticus]|uniref:Uncharacterized protein n=1 Tax=Cupriavidus oxalaticus TaxID=96344 RepID=A0A4P7LEA1_9BURK|nr:hypothetical protein [Cupriavidus oxalaticus]QBY52529.1 hypothetical protein E0W60_15170 [Cupriavidus oxalaticus]